MANPTGKGGFGERKHQINRKGKPKNFDQLRALAKAIAHEELIDKDGKPLGTLVERTLRDWFVSTDPRLQIQAMNIAFGKVPDKLELTGKRGRPIESTIEVKTVNYRTDITTETES